jgi:hypothetical protein
MSITKLSFVATNNSQFNDLAVECWLDNIKFFDNVIGPGSHQIGHVADLAEDEHVLKIILKNKTSGHTTITPDGSIVQDAVINISKIFINNIAVDQLFWQMSEYVHNANGSLAETSAYHFYGDLGCNGTVSMTFSTPVYLWLLENM